MPPEAPLLSIAIPTYNRSVYLAELLRCLAPQIALDRRIELLISDNASSDDTQAVVEQFQAGGLALRYLRNPENLGADANFLQCLDRASGKYVWLLGDDDLLAANTIPRLLQLLERDDYDLIYLSSVGFTADDRPAPPPDPFHRFAERVTDGDFFMDKVNSMITLISANIINKHALNATPHPPLASLNDSKLLQLGWLLPVIHRRCRILYVWERLVFHRTFNSGGWGICEVFGQRLNAISTLYFAAEPSLARNLMNGVLSMWLPDHILQMRRGDLTTMQGEDFALELRPTFARNWRFWIFVYPASTWPLALAIPTHRVLRTSMKLLRAATMLLHHLTHRRNLLEA